jgi:hypothetical protein
MRVHPTRAAPPRKPDGQIAPHQLWSHLSIGQQQHVRQVLRRAGRCWGLCCRRYLLSLNIHVWIPTLKHRTQLPVQRPHSCL